MSELWALFPGILALCLLSDNLPQSSGKCLNSSEQAACQGFQGSSLEVSLSAGSGLCGTTSAARAQPLVYETVALGDETPSSRCQDRALRAAVVLGNSQDTLWALVRASAKCNLLGEEVGSCE